MQNSSTLSLKNDVVFKELFSKKGNEIFLKDFLSDLLETDIKTIEIKKDTALKKGSINEKYGILDIKATLNDDSIIDIEMQLTNYKNMEERALYYSAKLISEQLQSGQDYIDLKQVIVIAILNFDILPFDEYITETITVPKEHLDYEVIKKQKFYFIELPKFRKKNLNLDKKKDQWLTFIDGENKKGVVDVMRKNSVIKKAEEELEYLTGDEELRRIAELREKALKDHNSFVNGARREGLKEGMEKGYEKGIYNTVILMLKNNFNDEQIISATGINNEKLVNIKSKLQQ